MSQAHGRAAQRGGPLRTPDALADDFADSNTANALGLALDHNSFASHASPSSPRNVRMPTTTTHGDNTASGSSSAIQSLTSASTLSTLEGKLEGSPSEATARQGLLRDSFLDQWKDDTASAEHETPEDMQKNDPLGTQIWKLYHRTKGQLPNGERLENLTWRMMSMNLRRKERERQQQGYALFWSPVFCEDDGKLIFVRLDCLRGHSQSATLPAESHNYDSLPIRRSGLPRQTTL
jgi:hypothetical protein